MHMLAYFIIAKQTKEYTRIAESTSTKGYETMVLGNASQHGWGGVHAFSYKAGDIAPNGYQYTMGMAKYVG